MAKSSRGTRTIYPRQSSSRIAVPMFTKLGPHMKIEDQLKFFLGSMTLMGTGVAFTLKFLLDAKDYPQLSIVMLAIVAFFIGTMAFVGALAIWGFLFADVATSSKQTWSKASKSAKAGLIVIAVPAFTAMVGLAIIAWITFYFSVQNLGTSLSGFRKHLERQVINPTKHSRNSE